MDCDMCGSETKLFKTIIEGTEMNVCTECSRFGKVLGELREEQKIKKQPSIQQPEVQRPTLIQSIVKDYAIRIKSAREKLNLKQKDFAQKISEKESTVHKLETGTFKPNFPLARKLEKFLKVKLVEQYEDEVTKGTQTKSNSYTLGDFIKVRKR